MQFAHASNRTMARFRELIVLLFVASCADAGFWLHLGGRELGEFVSRRCVEFCVQFVFLQCGMASYCRGWTEMKKLTASKAEASHSAGGRPKLV